MWNSFRQDAGQDRFLPPSVRRFPLWLLILLVLTPPAWGGLEPNRDDPARQSGQAKADYQELGAKDPGNTLADDAFFILGTIYLGDKKDPAKAARTYAKIIAIYPEGDMAGIAAEQLLKIKHGAATPTPAPTGEEVGERCISPLAGDEPPPKVLA